MKRALWVVKYDGASTNVPTTITVNNVAPTASVDGMLFPYPDYILPIVHTLDFTATATDPGSDDLTFTWDWDDGTHTTTIYYNNGVSPDLSPSPNINPLTVTDTITQVYMEPGTYTVTLTVEDDDGGVDTDTYDIQILSAEEATQGIADCIQDLSDGAFRGQADQRQKAFNNMFSAIQDKLSAEEYLGAIRDLLHNIRAKADGTIGGSPKDDWVTDSAAQGIICWNIDALVTYLEPLL